MDSSNVEHPVTSVEMLVGGKWIDLPELPTLKHRNGVKMSLPTALQWMPGQGLQLIGGCYVDWNKGRVWCTTKVWSLQYDGGEPGKRSNSDD